MSTRTEQDRTESRNTELRAAECWARLEAESFGRIAVHGLDGVPDIFPVNYAVHHGSLYVRTTHGTKLMDIATYPVAAFEIDGEEDGWRWSVVLRGAATRVSMDAEIRASGILGLTTETPSSKHHFIRVTPTSVTGRQFAVGSRSVPATHEGPYPIRRADVDIAVFDPVEPIESDQPRSTRPINIPHLPPQRP